MVSVVLQEKILPDMDLNELCRWLSLSGFELQFLLD